MESGPQICKRLWCFFAWQTVGCKITPIIHDFIGESHAHGLVGPDPGLCVEQGLQILDGEMRQTGSVYLHDHVLPDTVQHAGRVSMIARVPYRQGPGVVEHEPAARIHEHAVPRPEHDGRGDGAGQTHDVHGHLTRVHAQSRHDRHPRKHIPARTVHVDVQVPGRQATDIRHHLPRFLYGVHQIQFTRGHRLPPGVGSSLRRLDPVPASWASWVPVSDPVPARPPSP